MYTIVDQGVTIGYMTEGYRGTESDLQTLVEIIEKTDLTRPEVEKTLRDHRLYDFLNFDADTIGLERITLIFEKDSLTKVEMSW